MIFILQIWSQFSNSSNVLSHWMFGIYVFGILEFVSVVFSMSIMKVNVSVSFQVILGHVEAVKF